MLSNITPFKNTIQQHQQVADEVVEERDDNSDNSSRSDAKAASSGGGGAAKDSEDGTSTTTSAAAAGGGGNLALTGLKRLNAFDLINQCGGIALNRMLLTAPERQIVKVRQFTSSLPPVQVLQGIDAALQVKHARFVRGYGFSFESHAL
jgi:hypothetical protein